MKRFLLLAILAALGAGGPARGPRTKAEWDRLTLVGVTDAMRTRTVGRLGEITLDSGERDVYRARTRYGRYSRLGNTIIANLPSGGVGYFAYDEATGLALAYLDEQEAVDNNAPGPDKRVKVPESCHRCHKGKFVPE